MNILLTELLVEHFGHAGTTLSVVCDLQQSLADVMNRITGTKEIKMNGIRAIIMAPITTTNGSNANFLAAET